MTGLYLTELQRLPEQRQVRLTFSDGFVTECDYSLLRGYCPCAECQGHWAQEVSYRPPSSDVEPVSIEPVGNYAVSFHWSDGHATGIYRFDFLRKICAKEGPGGEKQ